MIKQTFQSVFAKKDNRQRASEISDPKQYWTEHNVTSHYAFSAAEVSSEYFHWRNDQYFNYIQLMPVSGFDRKCILDYGCRPGHDLIGFGTYTACQSLVGIDVSPSSMAETRTRLALHGINQETVLKFEDRAYPLYKGHYAGVDACY